MPIPFRDSDDISEFGTAGYLKIDVQPVNGQFRGALFLINARGEPVEFTYNTVEVPSTFLWRQDDVHRHAIRTLTTSLLATCPRQPLLILCLADEVPHQIFTSDIRVAVAVGRVASVARPTSYATLESPEDVAGQTQQQVFWFPGKPQEGSVERRLFQRLVTGGLLLEPFERAMVGLREVYHTAPEATS
jgi:hypothetical protein